MALLTKSRNSPRFTAKKYGCPTINPVVIVKYLLMGFPVSYTHLTLPTILLV